MKRIIATASLILLIMAIASDPPANGFSSLFAGRSTWRLEEISGGAPQGEANAGISCTEVCGGEYFFCKGVPDEAFPFMIVVRVRSDRDGNLLTPALQPAGIIRTIEAVEAP